jgi:glycosyltransferase involved in cell wall biosynthesis
VFTSENQQKRENGCRGGSDVGLLPTLSEGYSNSIVEDMTYGLPVLPSGILANRDALGNDFAIAYLDNLAEALASAILALYENPEMRLAMGKFNLQRVRQRHVFNAAGIWPF